MGGRRDHTAQCRTNISRVGSDERVKHRIGRARERNEGLICKNQDMDETADVEDAPADTGAGEEQARFESGKHDSDSKSEGG